MWSDVEVKNHKKAAILLNKIISLVFQYIKHHKNTTEYDVQQFILKKYTEFSLATDKDPPIIAFRENTARPHYYPQKQSKRLTKGSLVLIDLWGKIKSDHAPFADITWVAYYGKLPKDICRCFNTVIDVRDKIISFLKTELKKKIVPTGKMISNLTKIAISKLGFPDEINFYTGHCLGTSSAHGNKKNMNKHNLSPLLINTGYTIEPGIYIKDKFGIRSEIDFYITKNLKLIFTTRKQTKIVKI